MIRLNPLGRVSLHSILLRKIILSFSKMILILSCPNQEIKDLKSRIQSHVLVCVLQSDPATIKLPLFALVLQVLLFHNDDCVLSFARLDALDFL